MKKALILIIAGICLFQFSAISQKTLVGLCAGVTSSNMYGHVGGNDRRGDARAGFTLGMVLDAPIGKTKFSFQPGLHYVQKGMFTSKTPDVKEAVALRYADLHLNFVYYTKGTKSTRLYFGLGPSIGFNLPSKTVVITEDQRQETTISFGKEITDSYRGIDWGANGIIGVRFSCNVTFAVNYTFGLRNQLPDPGGDDILRNGCLGFRLGYFFPNGPRK
jgi:hypothetical protein